MIEPVSFFQSWTNEFNRRDVHSSNEHYHHFNGHDLNVCQEH